MKKNKIKIGFVGCGRMAGYHADVLKTLDAEFVSVCGTQNSVRAKEFADKYSISNVFDDFSELAKKSNVDTLWVTTPWEVTGNILEKLVETKLDLFLEKPVALNSKIIENAISLQKKYENKIAVGMNRRFYDFVEDIKYFIKNKHLHAVELVLPEQIKNRGLDASKLSVLWFTSSIHELDLIYHLLGKLNVEKMYSYKNPIGSLSYNGLLFAPKSGTPIHAIANWGVPANKSIKFYLDYSVVELCPIETMKISTSLTKLPPSKDVPIARFEPCFETIKTTSLKYKPGLYEQDKAIINYFKGDGDANLAKLEDAVEVTKLIEDILK